MPKYSDFFPQIVNIILALREGICENPQNLSITMKSFFLHFQNRVSGNFLGSFLGDPLKTMKVSNHVDTIFWILKISRLKNRTKRGLWAINT